MFIYKNRIVITKTLIVYTSLSRDAGTGGGGGQEGQLPLLPFARRGKGAKVAFGLKENICCSV